jgi:hypothetical protein
MNTHNYLTRIKDTHWEDIQRVKTLDNCSANSIINEGIRLVIKQKLQELSTLRKNRTSLQNIVSAYKSAYLSPNSVTVE